MKSNSDYTIIVEDGINSLRLPSGDLDGLYSPVRYGMSSGGKRLRPVLCLMACDAFSGDCMSALPQAVGLELFHNFTLLHDDVMDNSDLRRGRKTVHVKWDVNTAILSGDTMLTLATEQISRCSDDKLRGVLEMFNRMALGVYEGQRLDMDFEKEHMVGMERYLRMVELKTGVLLGASVGIGALIGGASAEQASMMYDFGVKLGVAFQIQDDYLDVYGDSSTFGKPIGGDILNGKRTYLLEQAYMHGGEYVKALDVAMSMPRGDAKIVTVTKLYDKMGIGNLCRKEINTYSSAALKSLKKSGLSEEVIDSFRKLSDKLTGRRK
ncbi:MAG: polyprenyl synthetase family protein [Prevotella sp.]|nr:polyprenyl synthetase family protein [Bacteroides sp.]MCM1366564.1 polyprenyl synthetase family protein [Prevotella sp.]MCM1437233.1 polyprenyl synthetase family protein [Prevotella sp.]